jgi:hypothetical protein
MARNQMLMTIILSRSSRRERHLALTICAASLPDGLVICLPSSALSSNSCEPETRLPSRTRRFHCECSCLLMSATAIS